MKKKIIDLLKSDSAMLIINKYCTLRRWTKNALGEDVDGLEVEFHIVNSSHSEKRIESRDWRDILKEVENAMIEAFDEARNQYVKEMRNGYIGDLKVE